VAPTAQAQFEFEYGPEGAWVTLFREAPGYLGTLLLHDKADPLRYITVDRWESEAAHDLFRSKNLQRYLETDRRCQGYTMSERALGEFTEGKP
jgi:heme-degrading monooxygenase HmoA